MGSKPGKRSTSNLAHRAKQSIHERLKDTEHPALLEALNVPVSLINHQYTYTWVNSCFAAVHRRKPEGIIGRRVSTLWGQETFSRAIKDRLDRCFEGVEVRDEAWIKFPALGSRYCAVVYTPYRLAAKGAIAAMVVTYDFTELKEMERQLQAYQEHLERLVEERTEELRKSEEEFRKIFENATEGIFQILPDGRQLRANPAFARIHGYDSPRDLVAEVANIEQLHVEPEQRRDYVALLHKKGHVRNFEFKVRRRDGTLTWVSVNARAVRDTTGAVLYHEGTVQDISQQKNAENQILVQRNLALELAVTSSLEGALSLCLATALQVSGMDCGAIHLKNLDTDDLEMVVHRDLPGDLASRFSLVKARSELWLLLTQRRSVAHSLADQISEEVRPYIVGEGIRSAVMVPVFFKGEVIASMNLGSREVVLAREQGWPTLELIAGQLGNIIVRIQARGQLEKEIETRREAERALEAERLDLQEANAALKVLLKRREEDKKELEDRLVSTVKQLVVPHVEKLKKSKLEPLQRAAVDCIEGNLKEILSPFLNNLRRFNFTPRQLEIIALIKEGRTTKDIAEFLHVSQDAIDKQRLLIRKKLDLNREANLRSYLLSLT
ncbi:MAG TPA: PAS domain S-box protein [Syntrophorhabdales bacterium]|nr:PAS domain S-box protein [Syntrophorhabdales bacterium]